MNTITKEAALAQKKTMLWLSPVVIVLGASFLSVAGCPTFMLRADQSRHPSKQPTCTSSRAAPIYDSIVAGAALLSFVAIGASYSASHAEDKLEREFEKTLTVLASVALGIIGVPHGGSAIYGFAMARRCRREGRAWARWMSPNDETRDWESINRESLLTYLRNKLNLDVRVHRNLQNTILLVAPSPGTCVGLTWTKVIAENESALHRFHIQRVECRHRGFTVWLGPVDSLPTSAQDTACRPSIREAMAEPDPRKREALAAAAPEACRRYGLRLAQ